MIIDDDLLRQAKKRAAETGVSVSEVVNRALREALVERKTPASLPPFRMVTFGRGQPQVSHQPADFVGTAEEEDVAALRGS